MANTDDLKDRVDRFNCMELPGQPIGMHMGTNYLVNDLWREVQRLRVQAKYEAMQAEIARLQEAEREAFQKFVDANERAIELGARSMKALVLTGSRADRNGLEVAHEALLKAGHESQLSQWGGRPTVNAPDVAVVGGDRIEILEAALWLARHRIPIAHIAGGDITQGSADDRYRDAITALACIHFATNSQAYDRLLGDDTGPLVHEGDTVELTGSPAIDRIKQTPVLNKADTFADFGLRCDEATALVCVHPNTVGPEPMTDAWAVCAALSKLDMQCICLGANADAGGEAINAMWADWCNSKGGVHRKFALNVSPKIYYSLMTHCDVMVGNSSAMLYEAPCFGLPCVLVGDRQRGRLLPKNVIEATVSAEAIAMSIKIALTGRVDCENPYGDGSSAPRIVKALEENAWRWTSGKTP